MKQQPLCDDKSLLMAYLYDECDTDERRLVEQHLAGCATCTAELEQLRGVRGALREWTPPEQALGFRVVREETVVPGPSRWWSRGATRVPAWAQLAAAVLVLAIGAAIANLDVRIGNGALTIHTGWQKAPAVQQAQAPAAATPWRADLAAVERQLHQEISALPAAVSARAVDGGGAATARPAAAGRLSAEDRAAMLRQVQALLDDVGRRQQSNVDQQIAERFLRLQRDVDTQRVADQRRFLQGLSQIDMRTTQLSQLQNYMLRVGNIQEIK